MSLRNIAAGHMGNGFEAMSAQDERVNSRILAKMPVIATNAKFALDSLANDKVGVEHNDGPNF